MTLMRWNPWREALSIQEEANKLLHDFFSDKDRRWVSQEGTGGVCVPAVDVSETEDEYIIRAELPGIKQEDAKVSITDDTLTIRGEKKLVKEEKEKNFLRMERSYGAFERSFSLGSQVDASKAKANFKDGVLEIKLAKVAKASAKEIPIEKK